MKNSETEKELNAKILKITLEIKDKYSQLSKYIEEMPVTIPDEKHPHITQQNLKAYYDSLTEILNKYILEHPADKQIIGHSNGKIIIQEKQ